MARERRWTQLTTDPSYRLRCRARTIDPLSYRKCSDTEVDVYRNKRDKRLLPHLLCVPWKNVAYETVPALRLDGTNDDKEFFDVLTGRKDHRSFPDHTQRKPEGKENRITQSQSSLGFALCLFA